MKDREKLHEIIPLIDNFLKHVLQLKLNKGKTKILCSDTGVEFLGIYLKPWRRYVSSRTIKRMNRRLEEVKYMKTNRVRSTVNSYLGIMKHYNSFNIRIKILYRKKFLLKRGYFNTNITKFIPNGKYVPIS